jgi:hypothetical protein
MENETLELAHRSVRSLLARTSNDSINPPSQRELALVRETLEIAAKLEETEVSSFEVAETSTNRQL